MKETEKALPDETNYVADEETAEVKGKDVFCIFNFYKLMRWCDEDNVPVPEDAIQIAKESAQILKEEEIFDFALENNDVFLESVKRFMDLIRKDIERIKEIERLKAIKAALDGDDGGAGKE